MFTLIVTGTGAAYAYSTFVLLLGDRFPGARPGAGAPLYFEATAVTTAIVLLGTDPGATGLYRPGIEASRCGRSWNFALYTVAHRVLDKAVRRGDVPLAVEGASWAICCAMRPGEKHSSGRPRRATA